MKNHSVKRDFKPVDYSFIKPSEMPIKYPAFSVVNKYYRAKVEEYTEILESIGIKDLSYLYNNLDSVIIITKSSDSVFRHTNTYDTFGFYDSYSNVIYLDESCADEHFPHEFLHLASSNTDLDNFRTHVGFLQATDKNEIGRGINEAYTQLLAERYFDAKEGAYDIEKLFVLKLEEIIGSKHMTNMYFRGDLLSLTEELSMYDDIDSVVEFIHNFDFICKYLDKSKYTEEELRFLKRSFKNIVSKLILWYGKKLRRDLKLNKITMDEFYILYEDFIDSFSNSIYLELSDISIKYLDFETLEEIVRNVGLKLVKADPKVLRKN